jgi:hypothetical protein
LHGNTEEVGRLLDAGVPVNARDAVKTGSNPFQIGKLISYGFDTYTNSFLLSLVSLSPVTFVDRRHGPDRG